jgi:hypothetical protein
MQMLSAGGDGNNNATRRQPKTGLDYHVWQFVVWTLKGEQSMFDIPAIGKLLGLAVQIGQYFAKIWQWKKAKSEKTEDEQMRIIVDELRRRAYANAGNCVRPEIGSVQDRLCSRMVARGYLARVQFGYMLPELVQHEGPESWC